MPYGLVVVLWLLVPMRIREGLRRPPGRIRAIAFGQAFAVILLLGLPVLAVASFRLENTGWTHSDGDRGFVSGGSTTTCRGYFQDANLLIGPIQLARTRMHVGLCWDGKTVTRDWGPDCQPPSGLILGGGTITCQVINGGTAIAQPESTFSVFPFSIPFWHRDARMRFQVHPDGSTGGVESAFGFAHGILLDVQGEGTTATSQFAVDRPWQLTFSYDCSAGPGRTFQMEMVQDQHLSNGGSTFTAAGGTPGELKFATDVRMAVPGVYHFQVTSSCPWHLSVRD